MKFKKLLPFVLALSVVFLSACNSDNGAETSTQGTTLPQLQADDGELKLEDSEDMVIEQIKVEIANFTDKDAAELLVAPAGTQNWSVNMLSSDGLKANTTVKVNVAISESKAWDFRLVFADGTYQDLKNIDVSVVRDIYFENLT